MRACVFVLVVVSFTSAAPVPRDVLRNHWVGQQIYIRSANISLKVEGPNGKRTVTMPQFSSAFWVVRQERDTLICQWNTERVFVPISEAMTIPQAIEFFTEELEAKPTQTTLRAARAWAYHLNDQHAAADVDYTKLLEIDANNFTWRYNRATVRMAAKSFAGALEDYEAILQRSPNWTSALQGRANAKIGLKKFDDAIADLTKMIQLSGNSASGYIARGLAYDRIGKYQEALADCEKAMKLEPDNATAVNNKAWLLATCPEEKIRNGKEAVKLATRACQLTDWKNAGYIDTLAAAHAENGEFDEAIKRQREAMQDLEMVKREGKVLKDRLELYQSKKPYRQTPEK